MIPPKTVRRCLGPSRRWNLSVPRYERKALHRYPQLEPPAVSSPFHTQRAAGAEAPRRGRFLGRDHRYRRCLARRLTETSQVHPVALRGAHREVPVLAEKPRAAEGPKPGPADVEIPLRVPYGR